MAAVVVVGAGLGGLSCAARLAKLGHSVTVCEQDQRPGGLLGSIERDGFRWDAVPMQISLPAVLRDLFRKSGRPLERYVDLQLSVPARRHVFEDGRVLDLPTGSRAAQHAAIRAALGRRAADEWTAFVDWLADLWERLRTKVLELPHGGQRFQERSLRKELLAHRDLESLLRKRLRDPRLRSIAGYAALRGDGSLGRTPAFLAVESYVERTFGIWHSANGAADLSQALVERMSERGVAMRYGAEVRELHSEAGRVAAVGLEGGETLRAEAVVLGGDGARGSYTHVGFEAPAVPPPREVVSHGEPPMAVFTWGTAPPGRCAWTVQRLGPCEGDVLDLLASRGLEVPGPALVRIEAADARTPGAGVLDAAITGLAGGYRLGTDRILGTSWPSVAWEAGHVAAMLGRPPRG